MGHNNLSHNPIKCFDWNHLEDNQLYFMYRSEECRLFTRREHWQQWVQPPSNMRKQLAIKLRRLVPLNSLDTYEDGTSRCKYVLTFFVTAVPRQIDENNIVEMQTNYIQKIPLHWFHLPNWELTKGLKHNLGASDQTFIVPVKQCKLTLLNILL